MAKKDKIKPLKYENSVDGTENDMRATETDPSEDLVAAKGIAFENQDETYIQGNATVMEFKDQDANNSGSIFTLFQLRNALNNFFSAVGWVSTNVRDAIIEARDQAIAIDESKAGNVSAGSFTGTPLTYAVVFTTPHTSVNYKIDITGVDERVWTYSSKTVNGFTIEANANKALTGEVSWSTRLVGEL